MNVSPNMQEAARRIAESRIARQPFAGLPGGLQPINEVAAYQIQDQVHAHLAAAGYGRQVGYKIGATTAVMQRYLNIDHPCAGAIFARGLMRNGSALKVGDLVRPGVECELDVELARPLEPSAAPFDRDNVAAAVGAVFPAIEIVDDRYVHWRSLDAGTLIADDFFQAGLVLGPRFTHWQSLDLGAIAGAAFLNGAEIGRGKGADILGHPLDALAWLANHCARRGVTLARGTLVSLGSLIQTHWLEPGDALEFEMEHLGHVSIRYAA